MFQPLFTFGYGLSVNMRYNVYLNVMIKKNYILLS